MDSCTDHAKATHINDLPNEVLEYILSLLSPYRDYESALLVCQRWNSIMKDVQEQEMNRFTEAVSEGGLWWTPHPSPPGPTITERYSHSACYLNKCLYVFGGCTSTNTAFNDLWKLDLPTGEWIRPLAMGTYPSPKAYATLVAHRNRLILFGGWSHPTPLSLHQSARFFQQLHTYTPEVNSWDEIVTGRCPPGLAGHGATVIGNIMVVFGGSKLNGVSCNDVWVLELDQFEWTYKNTAGSTPLPRYGHAQVLVDDNHILVVGGCGGPNMQFTDVWLLTIGQDTWRWDEITVNHPENCAPQLWCHPPCKVGNKMLVLSKITRSTSNPESPSRKPQFRSPKLPHAAAAYQTSVNVRSHGERQINIGQGHCCCCQEASLVDKMSLRVKRSHPETSESSSQDSSSDNDDSAGHRLHGVDGRGGRGGGPKLMPSDQRQPTSLNNSGNRSNVMAPPASVPGVVRSGPSKNNTSPSRPSGSKEGSASAQEDIPPSPPSPESSHGGGTPGSRTGLPSIRPNAMRNRQKQLEMLKRYEERIKGQKAKEPILAPTHSGACCHGAGGPCKLMFPPQRRVQNPMFVHTLDLSEVVTNQSATWLPLTEYGLDNAPEETIFYSLVEGVGELIMFGGIQTDLNMRRHLQNIQVVSNMVYFLSPRKILR